MGFYRSPATRSERENRCNHWNKPTDSDKDSFSFTWGQILNSHCQADGGFSLPIGNARWGIRFNSHSQTVISKAVNNTFQAFFQRHMVLAEYGPAGGFISPAICSNGMPDSFFRMVSSWTSQVTVLCGPIKVGRTLRVCLQVGQRNRWIAILHCWIQLWASRS